MKPGMLFTLAALVTITMLSGCSDSGPAPDQAQNTAEPATEKVAEADHIGGIPWFSGSVEEAFAAARTSGKPVFLYWGAVWCPPCNQLKDTVFKRAEFVAQSHLVVPVYLDGDTPRAQEQGDRFGVLGYPTVIMFNPAGEEITRIPGGLNLERYLDVLELALNEVRPVKTLVAEALAGKPLAAGDWRLLAAYSWGQDNGRVFAEDDNKVAAFQTMASYCPTNLNLSCSQLRSRAISAWAELEERDMSLAEGFRQQVETILSDPDLSRANLGFVVYASKRILPKIVDPESESGIRLAGLWQNRLADLRQDTSVNAADRLGTWLGELRIATLQSDEVSDTLRDAARNAVKTADESTTGEYARSAVINVAWAVLDTAGLQADADALLQAELDTSSFPYYFMLDLAHNAKVAGRTEEALSWLERAWTEALGPATRLQWGANYLVGALELTPDDLPRINAVGNALIDETATMERAFHGRNARSLNRIFTGLSKWAEADSRAKVSTELRARAAAVCAEQNALGCDEKFTAITVAQAN